LIKPAHLTVTVLAVGMLTAHAFLPLWMAQRAVVFVSRPAVLCVDHRIGRGGRAGRLFASPPETLPTFAGPLRMFYF
jgi:hypothetical protein